MSYCAVWLSSALIATIRTVGLASRIPTAARSAAAARHVEVEQHDVRPPVRGASSIACVGVLGLADELEPRLALRSAPTA